jgi:hypothetical protein
MFATTHPKAQLQAFQTIQSPHALQVHRPTIPSEQHVDPAITEAGTGLRQVAHAHPQCFLTRSTAAIRMQGT